MVLQAELLELQKQEAQDKLLRDAVQAADPDASRFEMPGRDKLKDVEGGAIIEQELAQMEQHNFQIKSFLATLPAQLDAYAKRVAQMVEAHQATAMAKEELEDTVVDLTETPYYEPPLVATPPRMQAMDTEDTMEEQDQAEEITQ